MILKGLRVENVKCFEDLNVAFVPGKNVIIGPNGAGKSTILQSILYSLFHEYPQGKVGGLIRHGEQAAEFALEFDHGGRHYAVERTLRRSGRQEAQLSELGQPDSLADNQKGVTQAVSETLQTTKEVFRDVVLVRQGEIAQIVDMPPSERKVLFDRLLGIHEYEQAWNQCRLLMNTLDKKLSKSMAVMEAHKPSADKLPERRTNLRGLKKELKDKKRLHSEKRTELKAIEAEWKALEELYRQIGTMETQIETQQRHLDTARTKEVELEKAFDDACDELEIVPPAKLTTLLTRLDKDIDKLEENIGIRRKEYNELLEKQGELTPLATREQELRDEIKKLEGEIESTEKEILSQIPHLIKVDYENWLETIKAETSTQNEKLREVQKEIRNAGNIQGKFDTKKAEVKGYEDVILSLQEQISKNEKAARRKGGADWKATARLSLGRLRRKLEKKAEDMESADTEGERLAKEAGKAESTVARFEQELADLQSLIGKKCPKCKQIVDEKHAAELELETKEKLNEAEGRVSDLIARQEEEAKKYKTLKKEAELLDNTIQQIEQLGIYLSTEVDSTKEIKRIEPKLKRARNKLAEQERALAEYDVVALKEEEKLVESQYGTLKDLEGDVKSILKDIKAKEKLDKELDHVSKKVSDLQSSALDTRLPKLDTAIQSMEVRRDNIRTLEGATNNLIGIQGQAKTLEGEIKGKDRELRQVRKRFNKTRYNKLSEEIKPLRDNVTKLKTEVEQLTIHRIPDAQNAYDESQASADAIKSIRVAYERTSRAIEVLSKVREFYREVQRPLRVRDVRRASSQATEVFKSLMATNEFDRVLITENHDIMVSRFGELEAMSNLSGGEQVLGALAVRMGFAHALIGNDLLILDEPTAYLDDIRRAELVQTLTYASPARQMLIVTHDDDFKSVANKIIRIQKDDATLVSNIQVED